MAHSAPTAQTLRMDKHRNRERATPDRQPLDHGFAPPAHRSKLRGIGSPTHPLLPLEFIGSFDDPSGRSSISMADTPGRLLRAWAQRLGLRLRFPGPIPRISRPMRGRSPHVASHSREPRFEVRPVGGLAGHPTTDNAFFRPIHGNPNLSLLVGQEPFRPHHDGAVRIREVPPRFANFLHLPRRQGGNHTSYMCRFALPSQHGLWKTS